MAKRRYDAEEEIYYFIRLYAAVGLVCHRWSEENGLEGGADEFDPVKSHPPLLETLLSGRMSTACSLPEYRHMELAICWVRPWPVRSMW